jgi:Spy/CpxP family protein refolding chaperone
MKQYKMLATMAAIALALGAFSVATANDETNQVKPARRGPGPALNHLLPPRAVESLNLTADQKTKYDSVEADFKSAAAKWREAHPADPEALRKARESGDKDALQKLRDQRKELMDIRKSHVDQVRATLTDEQKAKLDKELEGMREHRPGRYGKGPRGPDGDNPPSPPPPED